MASRWIVAKLALTQTWPRLLTCLPDSIPLRLPQSKQGRVALLEPLWRWPLPRGPLLSSFGHPNDADPVCLSLCLHLQATTSCGSGSATGGFSQLACLGWGGWGAGRLRGGSLAPSHHLGTVPPAG